MHPFQKEQRDPDSIRSWLIQEGFDEEITNNVIVEFTKRVEDGEKFGYKDGISVLSMKIRDRVIEVTKAEKGLQSFNEFAKQIAELKDSVIDSLHEAREQYGQISDRQSVESSLFKEVIDNTERIASLIDSEKTNLIARYDTFITYTQHNTEKLLNTISELGAKCEFLETKLVNVNQTINDVLLYVTEIPTKVNLTEENLRDISESVWTSQLRMDFSSIVDMLKMSIQSLPEKVLEVVEKKLSEEKPKGFLQRLWQ